MPALRTLCVPSFLSLLAASAMAAAPVVGWRTDGTGIYPDAAPPTRWSETENVVWKTELPGPSHSAPIVVGDRLFVVSDPAQLLCVNAADGEILWQRDHEYADVFEAAKAERIAANHERAREVEKQRNELRRELGQLKKNDDAAPADVEKLEARLKELDERMKELREYPEIKRGAAGNSTATPVCDGEAVYAVFGTGVVSAHGLDGRRHWMTYVEPPESGFGHSASPVLVDGKLVVHYRDMVALDADTGDEAWRIEVRARYGSPLSAKIGSVPVVISPDGVIVRAADGRILSEDLFQLGHNSPLLHEGTLYVMEQGKVKALRLPKTAADELDVETLWQSDSFRQRMFASPALVDGLLYGVTEKGILDVTDARTGELVYRKRLDLGRGNVYPSPTVAGGRVYLSGSSGVTVVLEPGREYREIARNELEEFSGSPVFIGRRMYVRGKKHLYCIGD